MTRVRQRYVADVGLVVGCPGEVHLPGERSAVPDKTIATGASIDDAPHIAAADVDSVIAFTRLNRDILVGSGEDRPGIGDGFATVATSIHHRTVHAIGGDFATVGDDGNVFCQDRWAARRVLNGNIGAGGQSAVSAGINPVPRGVSGIVVYQHGVTRADNQIAGRVVAVLFHEGKTWTRTGDVE